MQSPLSDCVLKQSKISQVLLKSSETETDQRTLPSNFRRTAHPWSSNTSNVGRLGFTRDQWLVVRADDDPASLAQGLRGHPILAVGAVQITAEHSEAVSQCPWMSMEEGFFLYRNQCIQWNRCTVDGNSKRSHR